MTHSFNTDIAKECGVNEAIILDNIYFWCLHNAQNEMNVHNGRAWTYNSVKAFAEQYDYLTSNAIAKALKNLESKGFLITGCFNNSPLNHTKWYSITEKTEKFYGKKTTVENHNSEEIKKTEEKAPQKKTRVSLLDREPKNVLEQIEKKYLQNYKQLRDEGKPLTETPIVNWSIARAIEKDCLVKYGFENIMKAIEKSKHNDFCVNTGYSLTTILSAKVFASLLYENKKGSAYSQSGIDDLSKDDLENINF